MHSHIHAVGPNLLNTYSARALDKSESAQRAADVRKKLLGASQEVEADLDEDVDWMVRPGYEAAGYGRRARRAAHAEGEVEAEGTGGAIEPISVWA